MIEIYMRLHLDGADDLPGRMTMHELTAHLAGMTIRMADENGSRVDVVIDAATVTDFIRRP